MPTYDYRCEANGQIVEVKHAMSEELTTWKDLCERADRDPGATAPESPVRKLATGGQVVRSSSLNDSGSGCDMPSCCGGGCGIN